MQKVKNRKKVKLFYYFILLMFFIFFESLAQTTSINQGTIDEKFNYIIRNSEVINDTRIIKNWWIFALKNSVNDTINLLQAKIKQLNDSIIDFQSKLDSLEKLISEQQLQLNNLRNNQNKIVFFGKTLEKDNYNKLVFGIILGLVLTSFILFLLYKRSNTINTRIKKDIEELNEEFDKYRKKTLEREQKIVREMYDEILKYKNKLNELTSK